MGEPGKENAVSAAIQRAVEDFALQRAAMIEQVCEQAIQTGTFGVLVVDYSDTTVASVDRDVPYGEIHYADRRFGHR